MAFDFASLKQNYEHVLQLVRDDLKSIKTGRAKPALVEDVMIEAYGSGMSLKELASITAPDPQMLIVSPWDQSLMEAIQKVLIKATKSFNPAVDGNQIRIAIPPLTGEKREELVKVVAQRIESGKQMMRNERMEAKKQVEHQKGEAGVSEDDIKSDLAQMEEISKNYIEKLEQIGKEKEVELRTI